VRAGGLEGEVIDHALGLIERAVDAVDLVGGDDVGGEAPLELAEALVVAVLEGLEGAHEAVEGAAEIVGVGGFGFEGGVRVHWQSFAGLVVRGGSGWSSLSSRNFA